MKQQTWTGVGNKKGMVVRGRGRKRKASEGRNRRVKDGWREGGSKRGERRGNKLSTLN